jgi:solute carrier family 7 (L-type amino acid transporter), member 9/15
VKNPVRTLKIAGPLGLGICAFLYLFANISYFAYVSHLLIYPYSIIKFHFISNDSAATKQQILKSGVTVASLFFGEVFGARAQKALTVFVALR